MDSSRVLIAVIISLALVFAYQELVLKRLYPPSNGATPAGSQPTPMASATQAIVGGVAAPSALATPAMAAAMAAPEKTIEVDTDLFIAQFISRGARLKSFKLKKFRETAAPSSPLYEMIEPVGTAAVATGAAATGATAPGRLPYALVMTTAAGQSDDGAVDYASDAPARIEVGGDHEATITFTAQTSSGIHLTKRFTFSGSSYRFDLDAAVEPAGGGALEQAGIAMSQPLEARQGYYDIPELQADIDGKAITENQKALTKGVAPVSGTITYAGFGDRYFLSAFLPKSPDRGSFRMTYDGASATALTLFAGAARIEGFVYMGPKELDLLEAANPALAKAIDFGWTSILALIFLRSLKLFHRITPNYGVDIILLTVTIRVLFLPVTIRSQRSMMKMQRLQPQMERLREKFKEDSERLNKEMVELYKRNHVNPIGGCLPMVLQLPIFIGLYEALLNAVELRHSPFIGWIRDLSAPDCLEIPHMPPIPFTHCGGIPVLVLLMGLSTLVQQMMMPRSPDPNQQRMMMLTPLIFTVMLVNFPAGLSLYYFSSNVLGIIQQYFLNREAKRSPAAGT